jgi:protein-S-isoprenylcysteine O-methyltransferase Ste14
VNNVRAARLTLIGSIVGVVGLALFFFETIRAVEGDRILSSTDQLLMWVGFGVTALGGLLLVVANWTGDGDGPDYDED